MELNELQQLVACLEASGFHSLELSRPDGRVKLTVSKSNEVRIEALADATAHVVSGDSPQKSPGGINVTAGSAGIYLATHPMRSSPWVALGSAVKKHDVLGLLKIGPIYAPITAPADGVVTQILASDGVLVGFGAPVLEILPSSGNA
jgi:acetyl-CoA carboxylase biotin carboxyl carrier protein